MTAAQSPSELQLDGSVERELFMHAAQAAPEEACGLLIGARVGRALAVHAATRERNTALCPRERFELDPGAVVRAHDAARARGFDVLGAWHSHPHGPARPSAADLEAAWPGHALVILGEGALAAFAVTNGVAAEIPVRASRDADDGRLGPAPARPVGSAAVTAPDPVDFDPARVDALARGVLAGDRSALARAITLVESVRAADAPHAAALLARIGAGSEARAHRVGISGVPGVGKSTLIDALGSLLIERGHRVAVLAVDPSSTLSGGSILGDKSRMARLARSDAAFIRPSPNAASLGGVARRTRETMALVEAAGYDVVLVETVGVGQSEVAVAGMVDTFVVLLLPGAGDELQGIKKGILELADVLAVNKCDGDNAARARAAVSDHSAALRYLRPRDDVWTPRTLAVSAATGEGLAELWAAIQAHRAALSAAGVLESRRRTQRERWVWARVEEGLLDAFRAHPGVRGELPALLERVRAGAESPSHAAERLLRIFRDAQ